MGMKELFTPAGVAVYGSVSPGKLGGILIDQIAGAGYRNIYAVNPKAQPHGVARGYRDVNDIPDPIDLAVIASPADTVGDIFASLHQKGVHSAIVISSGFSEAGNAAGEAELKRLGKEYDITFIGPNCAGLLNTHHQLAATLQAYPPKGNVAIVSQSGAVGGAIMEWAQKQHWGISKFVSYGNGADLNQVEFLHYLRDDPETAVVGLYIENVTDGRAFMEALSQLTAVKPVVVIKSGRTATGQRAALSHTGSMAGSDQIYDAALRQAGAIRVDSMDEFIDVCKGFAYLPAMQGPRVAIVTNSGGPGVMAADLADQLVLSVAEPSEALQQKLAAFLPSFAGLHNPIDLTVEGTGENYRRSIELMLTEYDACLPIFFGPPYLNTAPIAQGIIQAAQNSGKPVACAMETGLLAGESADTIARAGIPNFPSPERAIRVLAHMYRYYAARDGMPTTPQPSLDNAVPAGFLLEPQAVELLKTCGIALPRSAFAPSREKVVVACREVGYPVVMKVVAADIIHKSDVGGVQVGIADDAAALAAYDTIARNVQGCDFKGVMVYELVAGAHELIVGVSRDRSFGPVIMVGMGGIYAEILRDTALCIAPVDEEAAARMLRSLKSYPLLTGARGKAAADEAALTALIAKVSQLPFLYPNLAEADLNPVFASEAGAVAGDVRLIFSEAL